MRKYRRLFAVILTLLICLCGCSENGSGQSKENPLEFLNGPITLKGILSVGQSEYGITVQSPDGKTGKVTFDSPESMKGYVFEKADDGYYLSYGDLKVPLRSGTIPGGAATLFSLLSPDLSSLETSSDKANGIEMTVYTLPLGADGQIRLYTKKSDSTPLRVEFDSHMGSGIFHISQVQYE